MGGLTNNNTIYEIYNFKDNQAPAISAEILDNMELGIKEAIENRTDKIISTTLSLLPEFWGFDEELSLLVYNYNIKDENGNQKTDNLFENLQNSFKNNIYVEIVLNNEAINLSSDLMFSLKGWFDINNRLQLGLNLLEKPINILNIRLIIYNNISINKNYIHIDTGGIRDTINLDPLDSIYLTFNSEKSGKKDEHNWVISSKDGVTSTQIPATDISTKSTLYPADPSIEYLSFKAIEYKDNIQGKIWEDIIKQENWRENIVFGPNNTLIYCYRDKLYFWQKNNNNESYNFIDLSANINENDNFSLELENTVDDKGGYTTTLKDNKPYLVKSQVMCLNEEEFIIALEILPACLIEPNYSYGGLNRTITKLQAQIIFYTFKFNEIAEENNKYVHRERTEIFDLSKSLHSDIGYSNKLTIEHIDMDFEFGCCKREDKRYYFIYYRNLWFYVTNTYEPSEHSHMFSLKNILQVIQNSNSVYKNTVGRNNVELFQTKNYCIILATGAYSNDNAYNDIYYLNNKNEVTINSCYIKDGGHYSAGEVMRNELFNQCPYVDSKYNMYFLFRNWRANDATSGIIKKVASNGDEIGTYSGLPKDLKPISDKDNNERFISLSQKRLYDNNSLMPYSNINYDIANITNPALYQFNYVFLQKSLQDTEKITIIYDSKFYQTVADEEKTGIKTDMTSLEDLTSLTNTIGHYIATYKIIADSTLKELAIADFTKNSYWVSQKFINNKKVVYNPLLNSNFNQSYNNGFARNNLFLSYDADENNNKILKTIHFDTENYSNLVQLPLLKPLTITITGADGVKEIPKAFYWIKVNDKSI